MASTELFTERTTLPFLSRSLGTTTEYRSSNLRGLGVLADRLYRKERSLISFRNGVRSCDRRRAMAILDAKEARSKFHSLIDEIAKSPPGNCDSGKKRECISRFGRNLECNGRNGELAVDRRNARINLEGNKYSSFRARRGSYLVNTKHTHTTPLGSDTR